MTTPLRWMITIPCLAVAAFSVFGFLASFEPGIAWDWKAGYAMVFAVMSLGIAAVWRSGRNPT